MQYKRKIINVGGSLAVVIPADLNRYMDLTANDDIIIQDDKGRHGKFISIWKKE